MSLDASNPKESLLGCADGYSEESLYLAIVTAQCWAHINMNLRLNPAIQWNFTPDPASWHVYGTFRTTFKEVPEVLRKALPGKIKIEVTIGNWLHPEDMALPAEEHDYMWRYSVLRFSTTIFGRPLDAA